MGIKRFVDVEHLPQSRGGTCRVCVCFFLFLLSTIIVVCFFFFFRLSAGEIQAVHGGSLSEEFSEVLTGLFLFVLCFFFSKG